jgi:hypothetical protein
LKQKLTYNIAGHKLEIFSDFPEQLKKTLYGFAPFFTDEADILPGEPIMQFIIDEAQNDKLTPFQNTETTIIHTFDIEEGKCRLGKRGGKYFFTIEEQIGDMTENTDIKHISLTLEMETGSPIIHCACDAQRPLNASYLKFSLWMAVAFVGIPVQSAALHGSVIIYGGQTIIFLGESGTGKSTHTKLWLSHILGSRLLNDDSPIIRIEVDEANHLTPYVYGSPWSGKGRCHLNERYPVAAFVRLQQHAANKITKLSKLEAFGALYPSFPPAFLKDDYFEEQICGIISNIIMTTPVYRLQCLPDSTAAELVKITVFN